MESSKLFLHTVVILVVTTVVNSQDPSLNNCEPGSVPQYALVANKNVGEGRRVEITHVTKSTCSHLCTANRNELGEDYSCKAFGRQEDSNVCYLYSEDAYERGVTNTTGASGIMMYEKMCLTAPQTCTLVPAFEKSTGRVLTGFTHVVIEKIQSEEECLSECLRSMETHNFRCMSVMYYYDSKDCMLNFDSKVTPGAHDFFSNETENYNVNYYDNLCAIRKRDAGIAFNACPDKATPTFIRYNQSRLLEFEIVTYFNVTLLECLSRCNKVEDFTCNSITYSSTNESCSLSHVDSRTQPLSRADADSQESALENAYYERLCVEGARVLCNDDNSISFDARSSSHLHSDYLIVSFPGISLEECLTLCLLDPSNHCRSVNYDRKFSSCHLNNATQLDAPMVDDEDESSQMTYYENLCHPDNATLVLEPVGGKPSTAAESNANETTKQIVSPTPELDVLPICEYSDMRVRLVSERPFTGFVFAKNRFGSCREDVEDEAEIELSLQFPNFQGNESPCGIVETSPSTYSVVVVVTTNNMGIPGLVTEGDRFFNVTCDFSTAVSNLVTATGRSMSVSSQRDAPALYPDGVIDIPSPLNMHVSKTNSSDSPVKTAVLGEKLNLDFRFYPGFNRNVTGLFVRQCNASRQFGPPPQPDPLVLIDDGCPSATSKGKIVQGAISEIEDGFTLPFIAFRFDGSHTVEISCVVDMCEKGCYPTQCILDGQRVPSYGRRRRRAIRHRSGHVIKKTETGRVLFTVLDKLPLIEVDRQSRSKANGKTKTGNITEKELKRGYLEPFITYDGTGKQRQVCLIRSAFLAIAAFFSVICFAQVLVIAAYVARQCVALGEQKKM